MKWFHYLIINWRSNKNHWKPSAQSLFRVNYSTVQWVATCGNIMSQKKPWFGQPNNLSILFQPLSWKNNFCSTDSMPVGGYCLIIWMVPCSALVYWRGIHATCYKNGWQVASYLYTSGLVHLHHWCHERNISLKTNVPSKLSRAQYTTM